MGRAPRIGRHNMPEPLTTLIGRDDDRRGVAELVREQRIVTLVGVGGVGKTRLALAAAHAAAVARICDRLDGLPLALELAAARIRVLSPEQLAERIDERFELLVGGPRSSPARQQTLEAAVMWSYDLLDEHDRRLFERLSVFAGGFSLDGAESVGGSDDRAMVLDGLARLVNSSMLMVRDVDGERRFAMFETLRDFGRRRVRERSDHDEMHRRLAHWALALAEKAERALRGPDQA